MRRILWASVIAAALPGLAQAACPLGAAPPPSLTVTADRATPSEEREPIEFPATIQRVIDVALWSTPVTVNPSLLVTVAREPADTATPGCWRIGAVTIHYRVVQARLVVAAGLEPDSCLERGVRAGARATLSTMLDLMQQITRRAADHLAAETTHFGWVVAKDEAEADGQAEAWLRANVARYAPTLLSATTSAGEAASRVGLAVARHLCPSYVEDAGNFVLAEADRRGVSRPTF